MIVAVVSLVSSLVPLAGAGSCWLPPVSAPVTDPFRPPACAWCPGNRGVELGTAPGVAVLAVAGGEVTFAGAVAGTRYVVVRHGDGWRATYGGLARIAVTAGERIAARDVVGTTAGPLHFGLRAGERYVDPEPHLGRAVSRPRLVPLDGTAARPSPPPRLRCG